MTMLVAEQQLRLGCSAGAAPPRQGSLAWLRQERDDLARELRRRS